VAGSFAKASLVGGVVFPGYGGAIDALVHKVIYKRPRRAVSLTPLASPGMVGASVVVGLAAR
jgi:hypothetical protein